MCKICSSSIWGNCSKYPFKRGNFSEIALNSFKNQSFSSQYKNDYFENQ